MKQFLGFCLFGAVLIFVVTVIGLVVAFRDFNSGEFFSRIDRLQGGGEETQESLAPQYGWEASGERSARRVVLDWATLEPANDEWNFAASDADLNFEDEEPVSVLFSREPASPTAPWSEEFVSELGPEAEDYLSAVVDRYADRVQYWQIGDKMDLWRPSEQLPDRPEFTIERQAAFLKRAAQVVREHDDDAVIILPGVSMLSSYTIDEWFAGILSAAGSDWFDVVSYHYDGDAKSFAGQRDVLGAFLEIKRLQDRPVWLLDAPPKLSIVAQAYGQGDDLVAWSGQDPQLDAFAQEVLPFSEAEEISRAFNGANVYRFVDRDGKDIYVAWGIGEIKPPAGTSQADSGKMIRLSEVPVLIR